MKKIKEEELLLIKKQQENLDNIVKNIGILETQKHGLLHQLGSINDEITRTKEDLEKTYGSVNIDLSDGSYTPVEEEQKELSKVE
jgi:hypothetical protein